MRTVVRLACQMWAWVVGMTGGFALIALAGQESVLVGAAIGFGLAMWLLAWGVALRVWGRS